MSLCEDQVDILREISDKQYFLLLNKDSIISMQKDQITMIKSYNQELQEKLVVESKKLKRTKATYNIITFLLLTSTGYFLFN